MIETLILNLKFIVLILAVQFFVPGNSSAQKGILTCEQSLNGLKRYKDEDKKISYFHVKAITQLKGKIYTTTANSYTSKPNSLFYVTSDDGKTWTEIEKVVKTEFIDCMQNDGENVYPQS